MGYVTETLDFERKLNFPFQIPSRVEGPLCRDHEMACWEPKQVEFEFRCHEKFTLRYEH
jgi:hypothetical protein